MAKNIVIFADGTGQAGGLRPEQQLSNVYKLYRAMRIGPDSPINPSEQVAFYHPGLGSGEHESFLTNPIKAVRKVLNSALGIGISRDIVDCYEAIIKYYEPNDRVYLFGFSRGAYIARCVANVMNVCGVPTHDGDGVTLTKYGSGLRSIAEEAVYKVYEHGASKNRKLYEDEREEQARRFRLKYGSDGKGADDEAQGNVQPYFIGVFDTVAALGTSSIKQIIIYAIGACVLAGMSTLVAWVLEKILGVNFSNTTLVIFALTASVSIFSVCKSRFRYIRDFPEKGNFTWHYKSWGLANYDKYLDNLVPYARHAISVDETRASFPKVPWASQADYDRNAGRTPPWIRQVWFAGNHSDIGGSYPENESRLSDIALNWMIEQIKEVEHPLIFNNNMPFNFPQIQAMQHCEIVGLKESWPWWWPSILRFTWKETSRDGTNAILHPSVLERFKLPNVCDAGRTRPYRPESLRENAKTKDFYKS